MSALEARNKINKIKESTQDYQTSINAVQSSLMEFITEMNGHNTNIQNGLVEETLISYSGTAISSVIADINSALTVSKQTLDTLSSDATDEIKRIVDEHNNSIDPDSENPEPRLSYETISLSSIAGVMDAPDTDTNIKKPSGGYRGPDDIPEPTPTFEDILSTIGTTDIYSDQIENWDQYVQNFLTENNLSDVIDTIKIEGKKITCKLKNGKEITIENVNNAVDLLKAIRDELQKM